MFDSIFVIYLQYKDLLQHMIEASVESGNGSRSKEVMNDDDIAAHSITFMLAGYEITANALTYVVLPSYLPPPPKYELHK